MRLRTPLAIALGLIAAACSGEPAKTARALPQPAAFEACRTCHQVKAGGSGIGPTLAGLRDRRAGSSSGYAYSAVFQQADFTWDKQRLSRYLMNPAQQMPGTKMVYAGLADQREADAVADYVLSLP